MESKQWFRTRFGLGGSSTTNSIRPTAFTTTQNLDRHVLDRFERSIHSRIRLSPSWMPLGVQNSICPIGNFDWADWCCVSCFMPTWICEKRVSRGLTHIRFQMKCSTIKTLNSRKRILGLWPWKIYIPAWIKRSDDWAYPNPLVCASAPLACSARRGPKLAALHPSRTIRRAIWLPLSYLQNCVIQQYVFVWSYNSTCRSYWFNCGCVVISKLCERTDNNGSQNPLRLRIVPTYVWTLSRIFCCNCVMRSIFWGQRCVRTADCVGGIWSSIEVRTFITRPLDNQFCIPE